MKYIICEYNKSGLVCYGINIQADKIDRSAPIYQLSVHIYTPVCLLEGCMHVKYSTNFKT